MLAGTTLLLLLALAEPANPPVTAGVRAELDLCAEKIEALKARREAGRELERLLRRAQELAAQLERAAADQQPDDELRPATSDSPGPDELRERADAARDEADRLAAEIGTLDVRIQDARRSRGDPGAGLERAVLGTSAPAGSGDHRIRVLLAERAALAERRTLAETEAARLDAQARAAERDR